MPGWVVLFVTQIPIADFQPDKLEIKSFNTDPLADTCWKSESSDWVDWGSNMHTPGWSRQFSVFNLPLILCGTAGSTFLELV